MNAELPVTFLWPELLWLLLILLPLAAFSLRLRGQRRRLAASFGAGGLFRPAVDRVPGWRRLLPALFFFVGLVILLVALARPQMVVSLPRMEETVILVFDVSGSMAATDMPPTRLEAAKTLAKDLVAHQPITAQIGVVTFSESGFSVQPPSNDQPAILASIDRVEPQRGTSLGSGIFVSLATIAKQLGEAPLESDDFAPELLPTPTPVPAGTYSSAVIVLLSDGENNTSPDPLLAAQAAADRGVRIHTIGLGSASGTTLKVNGFTVHTQLDEALLQEISQLTGGTYHNALNETDRSQIYANLRPQLIVKPEKMEVTSLFAGAGLLFLLVGGAFSLLWFGRVP